MPKRTIREFVAEKTSATNARMTNECRKNFQKLSS